MMTDRITRFAAAIAADGLDAAIITSLINIRYLTGFTGSNAALVVSAEGDVRAFTDGRYQQQIIDQTSLSAVITREILPDIGKYITGTIGYEATNLSVADFEKLSKASTKVSFQALHPHLAAMRAVKDETELHAIETACQISTQALAQVIAGPLLGRTERAIARDLEWAMYELGAEALAFETICAAGENSAIPHHRPTERVVQAGDLLKIDFGARVDGYHADCTRTFVVGNAAEWQREIHAAVFAAQSAGIAALQGSAPMSASRASVDASLGDLAEHFTTGLGHGVGLEIHEDPFLTLTITDTVVPRVALTVEPGIYLPGRGGVRIEDTLVTTTDQPRALTVFDRELMEL